MTIPVVTLPEPVAIPERNYTAHAVVDWVAFVVDLGRTSNGGHLKRLLEALGVSRVIPLNAGAGGAATKFRIELQHPETFSVNRPGFTRHSVAG